jgi:hypothetical protein
MGKSLTICTALVLFLPGCVMGIPDSGPAPPRKPEPCEVWITRYPERTAICVSRARATRELCRMTGQC